MSFSKLECKFSRISNLIQEMMTQKFIASREITRSSLQLCGLCLFHEAVQGVFHLLGFQGDNHSPVGVTVVLNKAL